MPTRKVRVKSERMAELGRLAASKVDRDPVTHRFKSRAPAPLDPPPAPPSDELDDGPPFTEARQSLRDRLRRAR